MLYVKHGCIEVSCNKHSIRISMGAMTWPCYIKNSNIVRAVIMRLNWNIYVVLKLYESTVELDKKRIFE